MTASSLYRERLQLFQDILCRSDRIDLLRLRAAAFDAGIPDDNNYRSTAWKVSRLLHPSSLLP